MNKSIDLYSSIPLKNEPICLTAEQQAAYDALLPKLEDDAPHSALLYGVTGSGKTLVFLKLIAHCLEQGRKALVLVPEISLTPQMILRLKSQFGRRVAVQHSALNHTERLLQWQMIQDGGADIAVSYTHLKVILEDRDIDDARVLTEAAIFGDKTAVDEETVRLRSHIAQYRDILALNEPVGRKLDFLTQELNRETNTIGSKCQDLDITRIVVDMKAEIEKIREQIQNLE